jgi:nitroimidazol reductase NimA-like FMN-containing flavoprotein (pyridoxamine 5'-phosphate oxidase superfamily)
VTDPTPSRRIRGADIFEDALVRELVGARLICVFATSDSDGRIHAVPMWFAPAGESLVLATGSASRKVANLAREQRATLVIHDSRPGVEVCGVCLQGRAEVVRGSSARALVELVHRRYVQAEAEAVAAVAEFLSTDDAAIRFHPEEALTWDERASAAARALRASGGALPLLTTEPRAAEPGT